MSAGKTTSGTRRKLNERGFPLRTARSPPYPAWTPSRSHAYDCIPTALTSSIIRFYPSRPRPMHRCRNRGNISSATFRLIDIPSPSRCHPFLSQQPHLPPPSQSNSVSKFLRQ